MRSRKHSRRDVPSSRTRTCSTCARITSSTCAHRAIRKSIEYYKQAAARDPSFAAAHGGIALSEGLLAESDEPPKDVFSRVKASATRALALDPTQVDALVAMTQVQFYSDRDWRGARRAFERIVERYPNHALAHLWYGSLLTAIGPLEQALSLRQRTVQLDPLSLAANNALGAVLMQMARYPEAVQSFTSALELEPEYADAHGWLGLTYIRMGRRDEGIVELERCVDLSRHRPRMVARLAHAYGLVGRQADAERLLKSLSARSRSERVGPMSFAYVYAGLGKHDRAFASLGEAAREGGPVMRLKFDPLLDPLKDDPRFADLVRQLALPWP